MQDLDKTNMNILWNKDIAAANLIRWNRIWKSKCFRGLGFRKAQVSNMALQMKFLWTIILEALNV